MSAVDVHPGWIKDLPFARVVEGPQTLGGITPRQAEALEAVCRYGSCAVAAETLFIAEQTLKNHLWAVYRKLGISNADGREKIARACYLLGRFHERTGRP